MDTTTRMLDGDIAVIAPDGRLNMVTSTALRSEVDRLVGLGRSRIVVDLSKVAFMDSSGLGALVGGLKATRQAGGDLRIAAPSEQVLLVLRLTNMDKVLAPHPDAETAFDGE